MVSEPEVALARARGARPAPDRDGAA